MKLKGETRKKKHLGTFAKRRCRLSHMQTPKILINTLSFVNLLDII